MTTEDGTSNTITPEPARARASALAPTVWLTYSWAPLWLGDALDEARSTPPEGQVAHTRGREILFATCFAESYLFEWVRDSVLRRDYRELARYFPPGRKWDFVPKWADIPEQLRYMNRPQRGSSSWAPHRNRLHLMKRRGASPGVAHYRPSSRQHTGAARSNDVRSSCSDLKSLLAGRGQL